jgi:guanyl-specific ribonuclease Sa
MPADKAFCIAVLTLALLGVAIAQEPFGAGHGVIEKVDRDGLRLRLHGEDGRPGRVVDLRIGLHSRLWSVPAAKGEAAEAIPSRTVPWKNLHPGQFVGVIYTPGDNVVIAAVVLGIEHETETRAGEGITSSQGIPDKVLNVLRHIDKTGEALDGYEGGRTFLNLGRNGEESLPRRDARGRAINYREWDVNPHIPGHNRGAQRLVTGSDGSAYYTADHYRTFTKIR